MLSPAGLSSAEPQSLRVRHLDAALLAVNAITLMTRCRQRVMRVIAFTASKAASRWRTRRDCGSALDNPAGESMGLGLNASSAARSMPIERGEHVLPRLH